ncbi:MAG: tetratricopeptide repeat protein, partial [Cenarchaeum sp. SB0675_bin_21]|nr:tetratricopeptide repeat protein [Cenarchaeum sp. SB0675_bin_21]
ALEMDSNNIQARIFKGDSMNNLERYDEAIKCFDEALSMDSNNAEAYYLKGISMDRLGRYAEAIECCDAALKIDPDHVEARYVKDIATKSLPKSEDCQHRRLIVCKEKPIAGSHYCGKHIKNHY